MEYYAHKIILQTSEPSILIFKDSIGYEVDKELKPIILKKVDYDQIKHSGDTIEIVERKDAKRLRTFLHEEVKKQKSVVRKKR